MAWNEPNNENRVPWDDRKDNPPPDLSEIVRKLRNHLSSIFSNNKRERSSHGDNNHHSYRDRGQWLGSALVGLILLATAIWSVYDGFYIVGPTERGIVIRFGAYQDSTMPGLHWHIPRPIEHVELVDVDKVENFTHSAHMLTSDENIVDLELTVQYRVNNPGLFLFQDYLPNETIRDATETALREVVGQNRLDGIIVSENRQQIANSVEKRLKKLIAKYQTGMIVLGINIQRAEAPPAVKAAFEDVVKAREDRERFENKARSYANDIIPRARGEAARRLEDAKAYKARVVAEAEGESARFIALLTEYEKAPKVTRQRLYLETAESVFGGVSKVLMDNEKASTLTYLPLDQLIQQRHNQIKEKQESSSAASRDQAEAEAEIIADQLKGRNESRRGQRGNERSTGR